MRAFLFDVGLPGIRHAGVGQTALSALYRGAQRSGEQTNKTIQYRLVLNGADGRA